MSVSVFVQIIPSLISAKSKEFCRIRTGILHFLENSSCLYPDVIAIVNWGSERVGDGHEQLSIEISLCCLHNMAGVSIFKDVPLVPLDHVFKVNSNYNEDQDPRKVNMGIGGKQFSRG